MNNPIKKPYYLLLGSLAFIAGGIVFSYLDLPLASGSWIFWSGVYAAWFVHDLFAIAEKKQMEDSV